MRLVACLTMCLTVILVNAAQTDAQAPSDPQAYCVNRGADFYPYTGEPCKSGYQLGSGNCRKTDGRIVAVPCVDGSELARRIFTSLCWSVQPCVRPFGAVHTTAGHNALRGSGPGQKDAFDNALAHVGCPDRRIDRLCITCCSPLPTFTSRRMSARSHHAASATGSL